MRTNGIAAVVAALMLCGCASVTRGTSETMQITSEPSGAEARTSLGYACVTPCAFPVSRKDEFAVTITKAGYEPEQVMVRTQVGGGGAAGFAGNIILGGAVGMVADAATGAALDHCPNPVTVFLRPIGKPRRADSDKLRPEAHCNPPADLAATQTYQAQSEIH
jgi:hypothetical protein